MTVPAFLSMGLSEMILVGVVALLVFGGRLPEVMHTLGKSYAKFRRGMTELSNPIRTELRRLDGAVTSRRPSTPGRDRTPAAEEPPPYEVPEAGVPEAGGPALEPPEGIEPNRPAARTDEPPPATTGAGAYDEPPPV